MRIVIATVQVPFVRGGAEIHCEGLLHALRAEGHEAEIVAVPFCWNPPERTLDHLLACRLLDLTESAGTKIDRVIGLKFPAYLVPHPNKVLWILHQHRTAYDLWAHRQSELVRSRYGTAVRDAIWQADRCYIPQARAVFANSRNVANRLRYYCDLDAEPLYHPPRHAKLFYGGEAQDYFFFPSRVEALKRQELVVRSLAHTQQPVRVRIAGNAPDAAYLQELGELARSLGAQDRIEWLGSVSEEEKRHHYAHALAVIYPPVDEDFGYVTLEAMLSAKPVVTCTDSGGPLEFVRNRQTGLVVEAKPEALAKALDELWLERTTAKCWGEAGRALYEGLGITWPNVVRRLVA